MKVHMKTLLLILLIFLTIGFAIYIGMKGYKDKDLNDVSTNLLQIQAKIKNIKEKTIVEENNNLLIGESVPEDLLQRFNLENINEIRLLTKTDLEMLGLSSIDEDRKYIVNYNSGEVYYIDGFKTKEGEIYYSLSEMNSISTDNEQ